MCLLMLKPAGHVIPEAYLTRAATMHPHGFGIGWAFPESGQLHLWRSVTDSKAWRNRLAQLKDAVVLAHARYATHGPKVKANCHPAWLGQPGRSLVGHNGVLRSVPDCKAGRSDSRVFIDHVLANLKDGWQQDGVLCGQLEHLIGSGNKLAILNADASYTLLNASAGHWKDGVWYSNDSYLPFEAKPKYQRGGSAVGYGQYGWGDLDDAWGDYAVQRYGKRTGHSVLDDDPTVRGIEAPKACATGDCDRGIEGEADAADDTDALEELFPTFWHAWNERHYLGRVCEPCMEEIEMSNPDALRSEVPDEEWGTEAPQCDVCGLVLDLTEMRDA